MSLFYLELRIETRDLIDATTRWDLMNILVEKSKDITEGMAESASICSQVETYSEIIMGFEVTKEQKNAADNETLAKMLNDT